ncbi:MAG: hypothetical protein U9R42_10715, partial [Bacteroidota bacterium]|nr:hypothetical protein [Bacteroidota bacterium]
FGEKVGFTNKSIELVKDTNIGEIKIFAEQVSYSNVISVELTRMDLIAFKFSKLPDSFRIFQLIENEYKEIKNVDYDEIGDSLFCWIEEQDSLVFKYSVNGGLMDTLILFKENETANSLKKLKIKTTIDIYGNKFINFKTNRPLKKINKNRIKILEDSNSFKDNFEIKKLGRSISNYEFHFKVKKGKRYNIIMADSCFKSDNNSYNDTVAFGFSVMKEEELGIINLDLKKGIKKNIIVELIDSKDKLVRKRIIKNTQQITFDFLKVGSYKIRFIIDENSNGKWDTGELNKRKQAERVLYFDKTIELKANWELTEEFEISD